jgi:hypothetical protein
MTRPTEQKQACQGWALARAADIKITNDSWDGCLQEALTGMYSLPCCLQHGQMALRTVSAVQEGAIQVSGIGAVGSRE